MMVSAVRVELVSLFHQRRTERGEVLESDFLSWCDGTEQYILYIYIYIYINSRMKQLSWYHNDGNRVACSGMIFSYFLEKNISTKPLHCLNFFSAKSRHLVWPTCRKKTENRKWCHREDTPQHTCLEVSSIPSKTLISCFRCVWLGLELNSAGTPALQDRTWWPLV